MIRRRIEGDTNVAAINIVRNSSLVLHNRLLRGDSGPIPVVLPAALGLRDLDDRGLWVLAVSLDERAVWVDFVFDEFLGEGVPGVVGGDVERTSSTNDVVPACDVLRDQAEPCGVVDYQCCCQPIPC